MSTKVIAVVGASGHLGGLIADEVLAQSDAQLRLLVRPESRAKVADLESRGAQIVEGVFGAVSDDTLAAFTAGATTVVSAVQGGPDVIVDGQAALLRAARSAGVRRLIPSTFTLDLFKLRPGRIVAADWRRQFAELADTECGEVEVVHVLCGSFLARDVLFDFHRIIDPVERTAYVWGDGEQPVDYTTWDDTARYTAAAALDDNSIGRVLPIAGDRVDFRGLVAAYEKATGTELRVERLGSLADLDDRITELQAGGPGNFLEFLKLMYLRANLAGEGKLDALANDRYPSIRPTTVEQYLTV
ncbi:NmrA family NAD(P)-binding protein [Streptomyces acidiscabies]|uniref:NmrA family NAD(P)-binding protein n=1 Tax=Streptomyces acidiscabies TaxID=42234 RepID=A0AAP6EH47_9ACTN|nr:NmrA family NAD(P)-binding protein [Streptomyces acidiscabies]MBP5935773.1 NAD(P)H-binding protein [Streptomyces sp. LBUM 1476]MBZ3916327.1 NmrA family NAD(P)-binding protein [Streptomyces acidiscabies]MDX2962000.1 NmrA family NAD(P)-binding protein [Streptomyces acidiscabies]MDX3018003.1 NmrA family NAD(P)-binding protein [Streptomyces acidiscabies]MDX3791224.1 NmrA family NAD(P)-binding protein [Streptomyces acidiscabies]